jgi:tight adherence protein B
VSTGLVAALAAAGAVLLLPGRSAAARRRVAAQADLHHGRGGSPGRHRATSPVVGPGAAVALAERLAGVALAGLPPVRVWAVLADRPGPHAAVSREVLPWLEAGVPAGRALAAVVAQAPALRGDARERVGVTCLAVALDACEQAGAPLAPALAGLAAALRAEQDAHQDREAALAAPRATAAVMSVLPGVGLLLGFALGVNPAAVLLGTAPGRVCLALGCCSWAAGRWWIRHLTWRAAGTAPPAGAAPAARR